MYIPSSPSEVASYDENRVLFTERKNYLANTIEVDGSILIISVLYYVVQVLKETF